MEGEDAQNAPINQTENIESDIQPPTEDPAASKSVNPLRLARPLEKTVQGLSKTAIPPTRPMPMPTISPLCPPGTNKNGVKPVNTKNGSISSLPVPVPPASQPLKASIPPESLGTKDAPEEQDSLKVNKPMEAKQKLVPPKKSMSPIPSNAAPPKMSPVHEKDMVTPKSVSDNGTEKPGRQKKRKKEPETEPLPEEERRGSKRARAPPTVYESPDPEMAQILKTIKKQEEEEKRATVKNSPNNEDDSNDTENNAKTKQKITKNDADNTETKEAEEKVEKKKPTVKRKRKRIVARGDSDEEEEEESEDDDDYRPSEPKPKSPRTPKSPKTPKPQKNSTTKKRGRKQETDSTKKKSKRPDPVFFKDEYLAVRNDEGSFFLCKAMQNIYLGSRNITIQWLSNEDHLIPAKDNPDGDIYAHDFYDKTEFETILTSVELDKVLGKSKRMILPEEELARINKILQRAQDKADGKLDLSNLELTEDNPDGLDISLYKGEDQLDEIDRRRTEGEKEVKVKKTKTANTANTAKAEKKEVEPAKTEKEEDIKDSIVQNNDKEGGKGEEVTDHSPAEADKSCEETKAPKVAEKEDNTSPEEQRKPKGRPKKETSSLEVPDKVNDIDNNDVAEKENGDVEIPEEKRDGKKASKPLSYDQFDFLEEEDDEVMPVPKKRKSQDSITGPDEPKQDVKSKENDKPDNSDEKETEQLSTTERAILAEKERMEAEEKANADPTSDNNQPVKKRGRKPKPKE